MGGRANLPHTHVIYQYIEIGAASGCTDIDQAEVGGHEIPTRELPLSRSDARKRDCDAIVIVTAAAALERRERTGGDVRLLPDPHSWPCM